MLQTLRTFRDAAGLTQEQLEEKLILGPGWINRFENGEITPTIDVLLAILHQTGHTLADLLQGLPKNSSPTNIERSIYAERSGNDVLVRFKYANFDSEYILPNSTIEQFETVIKTMRDGLARLATADSPVAEAYKADSVADTFLKAVAIWPKANPSDIWWFVVYRAYCDPYNHPAKYARMDLQQSWKRTGGWALEEILVRHYGPFLKKKKINLFIADSERKNTFIKKFNIKERLEADKVDVLLTTTNTHGEEIPLGVVHVKASFAERRTDDVPMSQSLIKAGHVSPLWTMDCKSTPATHPINKGELGVASGERSAKRKDIEDEGYFSGCFSYNQNTQASANDLPTEKQIYICDFSNPDDSFSKFVIKRCQRFLVE